MIYALFICTTVTGMPQLDHCKLPNDILTTYQNVDECKAVVQRYNLNAIAHEGRDQNVHTRLVCMEKKPEWQPVK